MPLSQEESCWVFQWQSFSSSMCLWSKIEGVCRLCGHCLEEKRDHTNSKQLLISCTHWDTNIHGIFKSRIQDFCWKNAEMRMWGEGRNQHWIPADLFIVSASGRWAYNIRHTFFNWAFSRQAHHLAEPWPRVKQSSLLSNVLAGSHLKCVSNCKICARKRREPSNLYHFGKKCRFCIIGLKC